MEARVEMSSGRSHASSVPRARTELATHAIADVVTGRGKELMAEDTVAAARRLFENPSVQVVPVIQNGSYLGALDRDAIAGVADEAPVGALAADLLPTSHADEAALDALGVLDRAELSRLVVLGSDGRSYVGLVCLRSDRERLCVDAECHAEQPPPLKGHP